MKIILSSRKHHYLAIVSTFLITVALIAGIVGCEPTLAQQYDLTIASTAGGSVTTPGEGVFSCDICVAVILVATPSSGYQFVNWTGDVGTIADVNDASTTITLNGDYSITANFEAIPVGRQYRLTISSVGCGFVNTPGEGFFHYDEGTVVELVANIVGDNLFVKWSGDVSTIADVEDATTTITMNDDYSIIASFKCITGCFIATAAYGTPMAKEIEILREFRDKYLMTNPVGKGLVEFYYKVSPPIAEFITEHPSLKPIVRVGLLPAVAMSTVAVNTTPAEKMAIVGLLALVSVALAVWAIRRQRRDSEYT
jgi:uncharacterized repeat protein (TIGR02543 family)